MPVRKTRTSVIYNEGCKTEDEYLIYVVSDLHGYQLEKFKMLLKKSEF